MNYQHRSAATKALLSVAVGLSLSLTTLTATAQKEIGASSIDQTERKQAMATAINRANFAALSAPNPHNRFIIHYRQDSREQTDQRALFAHLDEVNRMTGVGLDLVREIATGGQLIEARDKLSRDKAEDLLIAFAKNANVEYVEPDAMMTIQFTPNDTSYNQQWHYFEATGGLNLPGAWDSVDGTGVTVAVIDTGITNHTDLNANVVGGYDFISDSTSARDGNGRDSNPQDQGDWFNAGECGLTFAQNSSWHGTHVAGTVAAVSNNNFGVAGVAFGARVVPVRALGKCGGSLSDIADAIIWSSGGSVAGVPANANPAQVINMSLGGGGSCGTTYQNAINSAVNRGTVVVVAAGNSNTNASNARPANCSNVITVAALDRQGNRASYSNFGAVVDVTAPGGETAVNSNGVLSTLNTGSTTPSSQTYAFYQGTSMAAPHVAGLAALMLDADGTLTPAQIESTMKANARPIPGSCSGGCGSGVADAAATIDALTGTPPPPPTGSCAAGSIDFNSFATTAFSNQDGSGSVTVEDGGDTLNLTGNRWRASSQTFSVTASTVIELEFASTVEGEIHGIGFDEDNSISGNRILQFHGTQNWGTTFNPQYSGGGAFQSYSIPVGQFYTGSNMRLVFVNDKDASPQNAVSKFRCVRITSGGGGGGQSFFENTTNFTINSLQTVESPIAVSRSGNAPSNLQVGVNIIHTYRGDLVIDLVAPDGTAYRLKNSNGSDGADNVITTYTVNASSEVASGTWRLRVEDVFNGDTGFIDSWSLQF
ncbi:MAG: hypothetical protein Tsb002_17720 [Wenzhouxiangellaceae bacterium]